MAGRRGTAFAAAALFLAIAFAGCADKEASREPRVGAVPFGWDEHAPSRSFLATKTYYVLTQSSGFLLKGVSCGRYVVRVDVPFEGVDLFFTSANAQTPNATH